MARWAPRLLAPAALAVAVLLIARPGEAGAPPSWQAPPDGLVNRSEVAAARIDDRIYVVGGYRDPGVTTGALEMYDISSRTWTRLRSLPIAVNHPAVSSARGRLFVNGGFQEQGQDPSARLYSYAPEANRWTRL